jgi:hypothetical protein
MVIAENGFAFYPSNLMQQECQISNFNEQADIHKKRLSLERIAENAQIGVDEAQAIITQIIKKLVSIFLVKYYFY